MLLFKILGLHCPQELSFSTGTWVLSMSLWAGLKAVDSNKLLLVLYFCIFLPPYTSVCVALFSDTSIGFYDSGDGFGSGQSEATTANAHTSKNYVKFISNPSSFLFLCLRLTFSSYFLSVSCLLQMFWGICTPPGTMITRKWSTTLGVSIRGGTPK